MGNSEPWMPGERTDGRPRIRLLSRVDTGITPQIAHARAEVLRAFVAQLCGEFAHLWPQPGTVAPGPVERRTNLQPWPVCWELHPGFVAVLWLLKEWHDALEDGKAEGGYREAADWLQFLRTEVVTLVRDISGRICRGGHVDPARTPPPPPQKEIVRPPLPGEALVVKPPRAPVPTGWREAVMEPSPGDGIGR
jgi:hypothetical protein